MMFWQISFENESTTATATTKWSHVAFIFVVEYVGLSCCGKVTIYSNKTESSTN